MYLVCCILQTISYMAERVVGTGSFGIVFQVRKYFVSKILLCFTLYYANVIVLS